MWFISSYYFYQKKSTIITEMPFNFSTSHNSQCCGLWLRNYKSHFEYACTYFQITSTWNWRYGHYTYYSGSDLVIYITLPDLYLIIWYRSVSHKICQILCRSPSSCQNSSDPLGPSGYDLWCLELGHLPAVLWVVGWEAGSITWVQQPNSFSKIFQ